MKVNIGGNRLGAGGKMITSLKNYNRSTHNLTQSWRSTMCPGALVPFLIMPALNGDTFDIDLNAMCRTIPTQGPLMGTFKLQMDVFQCPVRLYNAALHNNELNIGMNMANVKLPQIRLEYPLENDKTEIKPIATNCLLRYLGITGIGVVAEDTGQEETPAEVAYREINAIPMLAYYDIFKNYYANKQEENAYVISGGLATGEQYEITRLLGFCAHKTAPTETSQAVAPAQYTMPQNILAIGKQLTINNLKIDIYQRQNTSENWYKYDQKTLAELVNAGYASNISINPSENTDNIGITFDLNVKEWAGNINEDNWLTYLHIYNSGTGVYAEDIKLESFPLENIDTMRNWLLSYNQVGRTAIFSQSIGDNRWATKKLPYKLNYYKDANNKQLNEFKMNGLVVKTYQADLFNSWINTEWIDGDNGIKAITTIDTTNGLELDTLNLAQKVYNMLNRIAVSGGTYEDWQEAVYTQKAIRHAETPVYLGGMSSEVCFEEVVSTAATSDNALGTLAGKGRLVGQKGGKLHIKIAEPSFIIGIVSITPRLDYTQGNEWYMTDLQSMDDFHKPALDGIGFQNLMAEQAAWFGTKLANNGDGECELLERQTMGKVPAWINYMTAVDKAYGDFAEEEGKNYMILARNYEKDVDANGYVQGIKDATTYIDPQKFNYAFAYSDLAAQNFWVQILSNIKARRIMSAKVIPNL